MIDILNMVDNSIPERQSKIGTVLYSASGFFVTAPEKFTRNQKLAYIELMYSQAGNIADSDKFVLEFRCSRGLSFDAFRKAKEYGLYRFNRKEM